MHLRFLPSLLSLAMSLSLWGVPTLFAQSAYRLSDDFDFRGSMPASDFAYVDFGGGQQIAYGDFELIDGELTGSLALLDQNGDFKPLFSDNPLFSIDYLRLAKNSDGGFSVFASRRSDFASDLAGFLVTVSSTGQLRSVAGYPDTPLALLPDGKLLRSESGSRQSGGTTLYYQRLARGSYNASGQWVADPSFASPEIYGLNESVVRLANGDLLAIGSFTRVNNSNVSGQLVRMSPNGALVSSFNLGGLPSATYPLSRNKVFEVPGGELFVRVAGPSGGTIRLRADGTRDPAFNLDSRVILQDRSRIVAGPGSDYYALDVWRVLSESEHAPVARINADGSIDPSFGFDPDGLFEPNLNYSVSTRTADGNLLVWGRMPGNATGFAKIDATGKATLASPGELQKSTTARASWTPNGELAFWNFGEMKLPGSANSPSSKGIARADGSIRVLFPDDVEYPLMALPSGAYISGYTKAYDSDANPTTEIDAPLDDAPILQFADGSWLVQQESPSVQYQDEIARVTPDGAPDPSFNPIAAAPLSGAYVGLHGDFLYYSIQTPGTDSSHELRRAFLDGARDTSFRIADLSSHPLHVRVAGSNVFLYGPQIGAIAKPFGARFSSSGAYDAAYAPEAKLSSVLVYENVHGAVYADDGSMIHLAIDNATGQRALFHIPPSGAPVRINGEESWQSVYVDMASNGNAFVSGLLTLATGKLNASAVYKRTEVLHSAPQREAIALSADPFRFEATVADAPGATFQWLKDGAPLAGETSPSLSFDSLASSHAGTYTLEARLGSKTYPLGPFLLRRPLSPAFERHPSDLEASATSLAKTALSGYASGLPRPKYQWYRDGIALEGETKATLAIGRATLSALGSYQLRAYNALGESWSNPAVVEAGGWWEISAAEHTLQGVASAQVRGIYPAGDGAAWTVIYDSESSTYSIDKKLSDGTVIEDWPDTLQLGSFSKLSFSRGAPRAFAYKTFSEQIGYALVQYTTFVRLTPEGAIDADFDEHTLQSGEFDPVRFKEWSDGTVWAETAQGAVAIDPQGNVTPLPRPLLTTYGGMESLTSPFSHRLPDGSYTYLVITGILRSGPNGSAVGADYIANANNIPGYCVGLWPSGRALVYLQEENALIGRDLDGSTAWSLPLSDEHFAIPPYGVAARIAPSLDDGRFHVLSYGDAERQNARIYWIQEDGSTNRATPAALQLIKKVDSFAHLGGDRFAAWGYEQYWKDPEDLQQAYQFIDLSEGPSEAAFALRYTLTYPGRISDPAHDGSFFLIQRGTRIDGISTGIIAKFHPDGSLDQSFDSSDSFGYAAAQYHQMLPLAGGRLAVIYTLHGAYRTALLDPTGSLVWETSETGVYSQTALHGEDGLVIVDTVGNYHARINRYLLETGQLDPGFANGTIVFEKEARDLAVDSQDRIYVLSDEHQNQSIARFLPNGQRDAGYAFTSAQPDLRIWSIEIDSNDRLLAVSERLLRYGASGAPDKTFAEPFVNSPSGAEVTPLPDGSIYLEGSLLHQNGTLWETLSDSIPTGDLRFRARDVLTVDRGFGYGKVGFHVYAKDGLPRVLQAPRSGVAAPGSAKTLSVKADHASPLSYQWYRDGQAIHGATQSYLTLASFAADSAGSYQVRVAWDGGALLFPAATLTLGDAGEPPPHAPQVDLTIESNALRLSFEPSPETPLRLLRSGDLHTWLPMSATMVYGERTTIDLPLPTPHESLFLQLETVGQQ